MKKSELAHEIEKLTCKNIFLESKIRALEAKLKEFFDKQAEMNVTMAECLKDLNQRTHPLMGRPLYHPPIFMDNPEADMVPPINPIVTCGCCDKPAHDYPGFPLTQEGVS